MTTKHPDVDNVFTQLEAALCLLARAKGETPQQVYFHASTVHVRRLLLDGKIFQVVLTDIDDEKDEDKK